MFITFRAKKALIKLKEVFVEALILNHFNPKYYIQIKTNLSSYAMSKIFS